MTSLRGPSGPPRAEAVRPPLTAQRSALAGRAGVNYWSGPSPARVHEDAAREMASPGQPADIPPPANVVLGWTGERPTFRGESEPWRAAGEPSAPESVAVADRLVMREPPTACPPHYWLVEPTDARVGNDTLDAECKWCGVTRTFPKMIIRDWGGRLQEVEI